MKNQKIELEAHFECHGNAFKPTHSEWERNHYLFLSWWYTENHQNPLGITAPNGFWGPAKMDHNVNVVQNGLNYACQKPL